jgi:Domain of unknown function (DUF4268)
MMSRWTEWRWSYRVAATVPARDVWVHEALNFTPWLLANVDVLGDLLGMEELELDAAEQPVGGFLLDLIGRDLSDGSVVIVENQLAQSDHGHLGQILTYAAGTNPTTIVWIATSFRPEHRAALDWLNEHTDPDTRFFGVEIEVVRIGDSAPAPNFKLVAEPNDWEKQVKAATTAGAITERSKLYWDFFEQFRARVVTEHPDWTRRKTSTREPLYGLSTGTGGAILEVGFTGGSLVAQVLFKHTDPTVNLARFDLLHTKKDQFEQALGGEAVWDEIAGSKATRVYVTSPLGDVEDVDQWPAMIDWLLDQHGRFRRAIQAIGGLGSLT